MQQHINRGSRRLAHMTRRTPPSDEELRERLQRRVDTIPTSMLARRYSPEELETRFNRHGYKRGEEDKREYTYTVIGKRGKVIAPPRSSAHALLLLLPSNAPGSTALSILRSTAAGHFRDWEAVWEAEAGCGWEPLFDRYRLAEDGVLSVFLVNGTAVTVVDFDLSDV